LTATFAGLAVLTAAALAAARRPVARFPAAGGGAATAGSAGTVTGLRSSSVSYTPAPSLLFACAAEATMTVAAAPIRLR
jgi:hypothetical protein